MEWSGYEWNVGQWYGDHHPDLDVWWGDRSVSIDDDGYLKLDILPDIKVFDKKVYYTNVGCVHCAEDFSYGKFEWIMKMPVGKGVWPALWLATKYSWPPEIDCMEGWSNEKASYRKSLFRFNIHPTAHWGDTENHLQERGRKVCRRYLNEDGYNKYSLLWLPMGIYVFYNNWQVAHFDDREMLEQMNADGLTFFPIMSVNVCGSGKNFDQRWYNKKGSPMIVSSFSYTPLERLPWIEDYD